MAWNPSPEVAVARDAAAKLGPLAKSEVQQIIVLYVTADDRLGLATYGKDKRLCAAAKWLGDKLYDRTVELASEAH